MSAIASLPIRRWPERRRLVLLSAAIVFIAVLVVRAVEPGHTDTITALYAIPIALVALELGLLAGFAVAFAALGLSLDASGAVVRSIAFVTIGAITGRFGDRMRDAQRRQQLLLSSGLALAHLEVSDELPELLARRALELTGAETARVVLVDGSVATAGPGGSRSGLAIPIESRGESYGTLWVSGGRPLAPEDCASLEILALQTAVAAESRRLLDAERERALIGAELEDARTRLAERAAQLHELITRQEAERHHVAHELHEEAAQTLAATLLSLGAVERELGAARFGELRSDIDSTLQSLRSLAASLRPPALDLGLETALERLAEEARAGDFGEVSISLDGIHGLSQEAETMVYRVVQEAFDAVGSARSASVRGDGADGRIVIDVRGARTPIDPARLAVLNARMELAGGTLTGAEAGLRAVIPVHQSRTAALIPEQDCA
jgi:signal transduction histidine kinase